jgi:uncharacterized protein involved in exopolysaccharide biosynthesis
MNEEISLKDIISNIRVLGHYLVTKWIILLIVTILGGAIGLLYGLSIKPQYKALLTFVLEEEKPESLGGLGSLAGQFGIDIGGGGGSVFTGENLLALIKSRYIIQKVLVESFINGRDSSLADLYIKQDLDEKWAQGAVLEKVSFSRHTGSKSYGVKENSYLGTMHSKILTENLKIDRLDKKTSIISIEVISKSEKFSIYFAERLADVVSEFYVETKTKKALENLNILQHQTDSVRSVFNSAISGVAILSDANPNPNMAMQILKVPSQRKQSDVQINQAILTQLVQNLELAKVTLRRETPLIQIIDKPLLPLAVIAKSPIIYSFIGALIGLASIVFGLFAVRIVQDITEE